jgi:general stress protein CsbA
VASSFAIFHAILGFSALSANQDQTLAIFCLAIYLLAVLVSINFYSGYFIPQWLAVSNLLVSMTIPALLHQQLEAEQISDSSTWYVMGIGTLMGVTALRKHRAIAWLGMVYLAIQVVAWGGVEAFFTSGLIGAFMLVFVAHALSVGLDVVAKDIKKFNSERLASEVALASTSAARLERQNLVDAALRGALPQLEKIRNSAGNLSEGDASEARFLEAALRDEIRGRQLLNDSVRFEVNLARRRGVEVILLDEGGLADLEEGHLRELLSEVTKSLRAVSEGRVTVRAPRGEDWKITVAAMRPGVTLPDVWLRLK